MQQFEPIVPILCIESGKQNPMKTETNCIFHNVSYKSSYSLEKINGTFSKAKEGNNCIDHSLIDQTPWQKESFCLEHHMIISSEENVFLHKQEKNLNKADTVVHKIPIPETALLLMNDLTKERKVPMQSKEVPEEFIFFDSIVQSQEFNDAIQI